MKPSESSEKGRKYAKTHAESSEKSEGKNEITFFLRKPFATNYIKTPNVYFYGFITAVILDGS